MLDDANVLKQCDPNGALEIAAMQYEQASFNVELQNVENDNRPIDNAVVAGMGGSALAGLIVKSWLKSEMILPMEIVRSYDLPMYVNRNTLVIVSSYSGNTEETISCLEQAESKGAQVAIIASGGRLVGHANQNQTTYALLPADMQPRMAVIYNLCALIVLLANFKIVSNDKINEIASITDWLRSESAKWASDVGASNNYAKN